MAQGLKVYSASGAVRLAITDRLTRILYSRFLPAAETSSIEVPGFDQAKGAAQAVATNRINGAIQAPHAVTVNGSVVYWTARTHNDQRCDSILFVYIYE